MLPACALATITLAGRRRAAKSPWQCPAKQCPEKLARRQNFGGWSLRVAPVALWAPFALLVVFEKVVVAPVLYAIGAAARRP